MEVLPNEGQSVAKEYLGPSKPDEKAEAAQKWAQHSASLEKARARLGRHQEVLAEAQREVTESALIVGRLEVLESDAGSDLRRLMR